jgi:hypothetical protein
MEFRQINTAPSAVVIWCKSSDSIQACTSPGRKLATTPTWLSGITSASALHREHQARGDVRPRRTRSESVTIVILVRFVIAPAFCAFRKSSVRNAGASITLWRRGSPCNRDDDF